MAPEQEQAPAAEDIEVELFIEALRRAWGYDFSGYLRASLKRRILALVAKRDLSGISALIAQCLREPDTAADIVAALSVPHSSLFRDPDVFARLRTEVLPWLASHPSPTIWHAGCAAGEEAYSLAILLHEAGLRDVPMNKLREAFAAEIRKGTAWLDGADELPAAAVALDHWNPARRRAGDLPDRLFEAIRFKDSEAAH